MWIDCNPNHTSLLISSKEVTIIVSIEIDHHHHRTVITTVVIENVN